MENSTEQPETASTVGVEKFLGSVVTVTVKDGRKFKGKLTQYDEHMNLLLEDVEELKNEGQAAKHKMILLKGGNVTAVSI